jgi:hypothetical protein
MDQGRDMAAWDHTSTILATFINSNPFRKGEPVKASDLHPHRCAAAVEQSKPLKTGLGILKTLIVDKFNKRE